MNVPVSRQHLQIALGVLLLVNPLYVDALHLDQPNSYRYETTEVTYGPDGIDATSAIRNGGVDDDVACLSDDHPARTCAVEKAIHERGNLTAPVSWGSFISEFPPLGYEYAYLNDSFYEVENRERGSETVLTLNRTPADEAMADVADPLLYAGPEVREAVETGSVETRRELHGANQLWRDDGRYYVVYEVESRVYGPATYRQKVRSGRTLENAVTVAGIAVGLFLVLRGQRRRVERERR